MKNLYLIFVVFSLVSCKCKKEAVSSKNAQLKVVSCPENGVCSTNIYKNKTLAVKKDDFNQTYLEIVNGNSLVLKFEYKKNESASLQDSSYREEIFIELDSKKSEIETSNLENAKLYFARWCYCKGQTGYYKIKEGSLKMVKLSDTEGQLYLKFKIDEVPQVVNEISETFSLE